MAILYSPFQYIASTPPTTKVYTVLLFTLSSFHFYLRYTHPAEDGRPIAPYLTVVPGLSIWFPWTYITAGFVETSILELIFSLVFLPPCLRYFERLWGSIETIKFVLLVIAIPNLMSLIMNWFQYIISGYAERFLYSQEYYGQMALQTAMLVAFTQLIPEHQIQLFGSLKMRVKRLPMIYVTFSTIVCLSGFQAPFVLIQFGWLVSWAYLRFYKRTSLDTPGGVDTYGDPSETFAFIYWFPPFLHYPIGLLSNFVYGLALRLRIIAPLASSPADLESGYSLVPGGARAEAERRRALALKALDQRLATNATAGQSNVSIVVDESTSRAPSSAALAVAKPNPSPAPTEADVVTANKARTVTQDSS